MRSTVRSERRVRQVDRAGHGEVEGGAAEVQRRGASAVLIEEQARIRACRHRGERDVVVATHDHARACPAGRRVITQRVEDEDLAVAVESRARRIGRRCVLGDVATYAAALEDVDAVAEVLATDGVVVDACLERLAAGAEARRVQR